jgi:DNA-binding beta-propeller fold protein YncE
MTRAWSLALAVALMACGSKKPLVVPVAPEGGGAGGATTGAAGSTAGAAGTAAPTSAAGAAAAAGTAGTSLPTGSAGLGDVDAGAEVSGPPPGAFMLTSPASTPLQHAAPTFAWTASDGAATYELEVSTSETFDVAHTERRVGLTTTSLTWTSAPRPGQLSFWRVTAVSDGGARTVASNAPFWLSTPIEAGSAPHGVAATADGKAIVADEDSGLTIVDLEALTTTSVPGVGAANVVAASADGTRAFVARLGHGGGIDIVDVASATVVDQVGSVCEGSFFYALGLTSGGSLVIVDVGANCHWLDVIPLGAPSTRRQLPVGQFLEPTAMAVAPDGVSALVSLTQVVVGRVDLASGVVTPIAGATPMAAVAFEADGKTAWTSEGEMGGVRSIDLTTNTAGDAIAFAPNHDYCGIAISPVAATAVVAGAALNGPDEGVVAVLDLSARKVVATYPFTGCCVAITPDGTRALVTSFPSESIQTAMLYVIKLP